MTRHRSICRQLLLVAILIGFGNWPAAARPRDPLSNRSPPTQSVEPLYVAIMGQVGRPGVFELPGPPPQLAEFLNLAGGITPHASGSFRIIRAGRSSQLFLSAKLCLQLVPNDLVIVESKQIVAGRRTGNSSSAGGWQGGAGLMSAAPPPDVVQIGLINLISRPVIIDLPCEQANLAKVLTLLHQPVIDKGEITIFNPGSGVQNVALDQAFGAVLATGMVLLFDPATVNSAVLPRLPNTIRPEGITEVAMTRTSAEPDILTTTTLESRIKAQAAPLRTTIQPVTAVKRSAEVLLESRHPQAAPDIGSEQLSATEPAAADAEPAFRLRSLAILTAIVACCLGLLWLSRFRRPSRQPIATPALLKSIQMQENSLESLISGGLPVVEEPLQLPYESRIFGRPLQALLHRTDSPQALSGPHYAFPPYLAKMNAVANADPAEKPAENVVRPKRRVDMRHPRSTAGALDRALATFEGEQP